MIKRRHDRLRDSDRLFVHRLGQFPRKPNRWLEGFRIAAALIIRAWLRIYHRFEIVGEQQLRTNRSLVLIANHSSHLDILCLLAALPLRKLQRAFPVAAADYFFHSVARTWIAAVVLNALPFGRQLHVRRSLGICAELISQPGNILIIFPEGTRSTNGQPQQFKLGVGALVAGRDVTVVPCWLQGTFEAWPKGQRLPRPKKVRLIIGNARNFARCGTEKHEIGSIASSLGSAVQQLARAHGTQ